MDARTPNRLPFHRLPVFPVLLAQLAVILLAAAALFIHPNTLRYRLSRIEEITGLNINKLDEKFLLYLAQELNQ